MRSFTRLTADRVLLFQSGGVYIITSAPGEAFSGGRAGRSRYPRGPRWILTGRPAPTGTPGSSGPRGILPASDRSSAPQLSENKKQRISHCNLTLSSPGVTGQAGRRERRALQSPKSVSSDGAASSPRLPSGLPESWGERRFSRFQFVRRPFSSRLGKLHLNCGKSFSRRGPSVDNGTNWSPSVVRLRPLVIKGPLVGGTRSSKVLSREKWGKSPQKSPQKSPKKVLWSSKGH